MDLSSVALAIDSIVLLSTHVHPVSLSPSMNDAAVGRGWGISLIILNPLSLVHFSPLIAKRCACACFGSPLLLGMMAGEQSLSQ